MNTFERRVLRRICGPYIKNGEYKKRTNQEICQIFHISIISTCFKNKRLELVGHIWRSGDKANKIFTGKLNGKTPRGRPRQRWTDRVKEDFPGISQGTIIEDSKDKDRWREVVEAVKILHGL